MPTRPVTTTLFLLSFVLLTALVPRAGQSMSVQQETPNILLTTASEPPSGLISWWPGDHNTYDIVGHNPAYLEGATFAPGQVDQAFSFDGNTTFVRVTNDDTLSPQQFTVDAWVKFDTFYQGTCLGNYVVVKGQDNIPGSYVLGVNDEGGCGSATGIHHAFASIRFADGSQGYVIGTSTISGGTFYHLAETWDGTNLSIYVNGQLENQLAYPGMTLGTNTYQMTFGYHTIGGFPYTFAGQIDEIHLFDRALTGDEITSIYAAGTTGLKKTVYSISGRITDRANTPVGSVTVSTTGESVQTDATGAYALTGLPAGSYTVTPTTQNSAFSPPMWTTAVPPSSTIWNFTSIVQHVVSDATAKYSYNPPTGWETTDFDDSSWLHVDAPSSGLCGTAITWPIGDGSQSQIVWGQNPQLKQTIYIRKTFTLQQPTTASIKTIVDDDFDLFVNGMAVRSDHDGQVHYPVYNDDISSYLHSGLNVIAIRGIDVLPSCASVAFDATIESAPVYAISGRVTDANNIPLANVTITAKDGISTTTDSAGNYTFTNLVAGDYTLAPALDGYSFTPVSLPVSMPPDTSGQDFKATYRPTATPTATSTNTPITTPTNTPVPTTPTNVSQDSDGDGLPDDIEVNGYSSNGVHVDLPGMGAKKDHKDIFIYVDWMEESGLGGYSHKPYEESLSKVRIAFANAPVNNLDGVTGISLHIIMGKKIEETSKYFGSFDENCNYKWDSFDAIKKSNLSIEKQKIFHYAIFVDYLPYDKCSGSYPSGISKNPDDIHSGASDFIVAIGDWSKYFVAYIPDSWFDIEGYTNVEAGTFMHELGHNLGLGHGGLIIDSSGKVVSADNTNYKANYLSVMNYSFQSRGLRKRNLSGSFSYGTLDYSRFGADVLPDLDENNLSESKGLNAGAAVNAYSTKYYCKLWSGKQDTRGINITDRPVDWNCDNNDGNSSTVSADINQDGLKSRLTTSNDWQHLTYKGGEVGSFGLSIDLPKTTSTRTMPELTFEEDQVIGPIGTPNLRIYLSNISRS